MFRRNVKVTNELLYIGGTAIGISVLFAIFTFLKSKGINVLSIFSSASNGIKEIEEVTEAISEFSTGKIKKALDFSATMEKISLDGINYAQQMYVSSQIDDPDGTKRKDTALEYIYANLKNAGITIDDNVQTIAKGIVESSVFSNKTISELNDKINKFIDEKVKPLMTDKENLQKQIDALNQENATLKTSNEELQQKLTTVQNTIVPIE
jgi:FtsZ-binding cell division protein ZapB